MWIILPCANLLNSKHCGSGSGPKPAVLMPAAPDLPWPPTPNLLGFSALCIRSSSETGTKKIVCSLKIKMWRNSLP